jgi:hypothetical protein
MIYGIKEMFVVDFVNEKDTVTVLDSTFFSFSSCEKKGGWSQKSEGSFLSGLGYIRIEDIGRDWEEAIAVNNNGWRVVRLGGVPHSRYWSVLSYGNNGNGAV